MSETDASTASRPSTCRFTEGVATIELNRPQALNAWNQQFGRDLLAALRQAGEDERRAP